MPIAALTRHAIRAFLGSAVALGLAASAFAADPVFPPGSRVGLTPPGKMQPAGNARGFEDRDAQAVLMILEMPPAAYEELEKGLSAAALRAQGMTEQKREPLAVDAGKGVLITGRQEVDGKAARKWVYVAALADVTALIAVQVPDSKPGDYSDEAVRAALASIKVRASVPVDELMQLVPVAFDDLAGLRPFRVAPPNAVLLTEGPKDTLEAAEQPVLAVSLGIGGPEKPEAREIFARNLLGGMAELKEARIVSRDLLKLGAMQTHEIQAEGLDAKTGAPMKLVQWVRFGGGGGFIRLVGMARTDTWREAFPRFRAVRDGLRPR